MGKVTSVWCDHRIVEWFGFERALKIISFQPLSWAVMPPLQQVALTWLFSSDALKWCTYFDTRGKDWLPGCLIHRAEPGTSTETMLGRTKKCGCRPTITSQWFCISFTATGNFKEVFQEREGKNHAAFAWFKFLHRAVGSLLRREECLKVSHYGNEALSSLTCFLLHLTLIPIYFLISEPEGKGWRFAFHFRGTLSTPHEILPACLPLFHWINESLCSHALHSLLRNIRRGTWGTLPAWYGFDS